MEWNFVWRLCVAGLCGTVVGLDREYRVKDAGFRTHFLVAMGSALMMLVSQYGFSDILSTVPEVKLDPSRIAAQVVSGIGFIGAGTIIIHRQLVRGLTTAASLWASAGIGLASGAGMYLVAAAATVLTLVGLEGLNLVFRRLGQRFTLDAFFTLVNAPTQSFHVLYYASGGFTQRSGTKRKKSRAAALLRQKKQSRSADMSYLSDPQ